MRYIVMPVEGWQSERMADFEDGQPLREIVRRSNAEVAAAGTAAPRASAARRMGRAAYALLASVARDGPKVVEMSAETARRLSASAPTTLIEPNTRVYAAVRPATRLAHAEGWAPGPGAQRLHVKVTDEAGEPLPGARVLAFADPQANRGAVRTTGPTGVARFTVPATLGRLPRLQVEPPRGFAGAAQVRVAAGGAIEVRLSAVDPAAMSDAAAPWRASLDPEAGRGVRIGVVDTGVDVTHPDLAHVVAFSVYSFPEAAGRPHPHANHVAGLIGARGPVFRGLAPEAALFSYRIAELGKRNTDAFHLGEGITRAARDQDLHLINVSMVQNATSQYLAKAAMEAYQHGAVCIGAAGNDARDKIAHPAAAKRFIAVTAFGDRSVLGPEALERAELSGVVSAQNPDLARATFSNWGPETDFTAPGVGLISCRGQAGYAIDSGTSFAAPVVTGLAAAMLSKHYPEILAMPKTARRAAAITKALLDRGRDLGFTFETQGIGIVDV